MLLLHRPFYSYIHEQCQTIYLALASSPGVSGTRYVWVALQSPPCAQWASVPCSLAPQPPSSLSPLPPDVLSLQCHFLPLWSCLGTGLPHLFCIQTQKWWSHFMVQLHGKGHSHVALCNHLCPEFYIMLIFTVKSINNLWIRNYCSFVLWIAPASRMLLDPSYIIARARVLEVNSLVHTIALSWQLWGQKTRACTLWDDPTLDRLCRLFHHLFQYLPFLFSHQCDGPSQAQWSVLIHFGIWHTVQQVHKANTFWLIGLRDLRP